MCFCLIDAIRRHNAIASILATNVTMVTSRLCSTGLKAMVRNRIRVGRNVAALSCTYANLGNCSVHGDKLS